jgi:hypothetical protein
MEYAAPRLALPAELAAQPASSEWWVVAALAVVLIFFGFVGAWCWFVCNGRVQSCTSDLLHMQAIAHCY